MNVVDSSGWLGYLADGANAEFFAPVIERPADLLVLTPSIFEVSRRVMQLRDESQALRAIALMHQGHVVDLAALLALDTARLSHSTRLPMGDSIMLATARAYGASLWTQHADFKDLSDVRFKPAQPG